MMKKRWLSLMLVSTLAVGMLNGCGDSETTADITEENASAEKEVSVENTEGEDIDEESTEEDEYLTISGATLTERELYDFFLLYLRCQCYYAMEGRMDDALTRPENVSKMLKYKNIVGSLVLDEGMRVVADYDDNHFEGLSNPYLYSNIHNTIANVKSSECSVSVSIQDKNFSGIDYKYKKGTDAEIQVIVRVTYKVFAGNNETSYTQDYLVFLLNNASNPEEWLIEGIFSAEYREKYSDWLIEPSNEFSRKWKTEIINEDVKKVTQDNDFYNVVQAYKEYVSANFSDVSSFNLIYLNEDDIPDLILDNQSGGNETTILLYKDGEVYESSIWAANTNFYYKEYGNLVISNSWMTNMEDKIYTECLTDRRAEIINNVLEEKYCGTCIITEEYQDNGDTYSKKEEYKINDVECSETEYNSYFDTTEMKWGWENSYTSIEESFNALGI